MKKLLSGTTALVAAGLLSSGAYAADPIKISVGGYFAGGMIFVSQDDGAGEPGANTRNHRIEREGEISFTGSTTLDNGIKVGINVQLEAETCGDQIDESFLWFEGAFGKIQFGSEDSAATGLNVGTPKPTNFFWGAASPVFSLADCGGNALGFGPGSSCAFGDYSLLGVDGDDEKITYYSPNLGGVSLGVSYTPDGKELGAGGYQGGDADNTAGQQSEILSIGARWTGNLGDASVRIGGGYKKGDLEVAAAGAEDQDYWGLGIAVSWNAFAFGAHYTANDNATSGNNTDTDHIVTSATYSTGPWKVGVEYAKTVVGAGTAGGEDEREAFTLGANYSMGGGVSLQAEVQFFDIKDNLNAIANENDATIFLVGTTVFF
jgi:outer membrane protein OmpU